MSQRAMERDKKKNRQIGRKTKADRGHREGGRQIKWETKRKREEKKQNGTENEKNTERYIYKEKIKKK